MLRKSSITVMNVRPSFKRAAIIIYIGSWYHNRLSITSVYVAHKAGQGCEQNNPYPYRRANLNALN